MSEDTDEPDTSEPWYESEDCAKCVKESEENGVEYEHNFSWDAEMGCYICDHCQTPQ